MHVFRIHTRLLNSSNASFTHKLPLTKDTVVTQIASRFPLDRELFLAS